MKQIFLSTNIIINSFFNKKKRKMKRNLFNHDESSSRKRIRGKQLLSPPRTPADFLVCLPDAQLRAEIVYGSAAAMGKGPQTTILLHWEYIPSVCNHSGQLVVFRPETTGIVCCDYESTRVSELDIPSIHTIHTTHARLFCTLFPRIIVYVRNFTVKARLEVHLDIRDVTKWCTDALFFSKHIFPILQQASKFPVWNINENHLFRNETYVSVSMHDCSKIFKKCVWLNRENAKVPRDHLRRVCGWMFQCEAALPYMTYPYEAQYKPFHFTIPGTSLIWKISKNTSSTLKLSDLSQDSFPHVIAQKALWGALVYINPTDTRRAICVYLSALKSFHVSNEIDQTCVNMRFFNTGVLSRGIRTLVLVPSACIAAWEAIAESEGLVSRAFGSTREMECGDLSDVDIVFLSIAMVLTDHNATAVSVVAPLCTRSWRFLVIDDAGLVKTLSKNHTVQFSLLNFLSKIKAGFTWALCSIFDKIPAIAKFTCIKGCYKNIKKNRILKSYVNTHCVRVIEPLWTVTNSFPVISVLIKTHFVNTYSPMELLRTKEFMEQNRFQSIFTDIYLFEQIQKKNPFTTPQFDVVPFIGEEYPSKCPVCRIPLTPRIQSVIMMRCGHCLCEDCFINIVSSIQKENDTSPSTTHSPKQSCPECFQDIFIIQKRNTKQLFCPRIVMDHSSLANFKIAENYTLHIRNIYTLATEASIFFGKNTIIYCACHSHFEQLASYFTEMDIPFLGVGEASLDSTNTTPAHRPADSKIFLWDEKAYIGGISLTHIQVVIFTDLLLPLSTCVSNDIKEYYKRALLQVLGRKKLTVYLVVRSVHPKEIVDLTLSYIQDTFSKYNHFIKQTLTGFGNVKSTEDILCISQ